MFLIVSGYTPEYKEVIDECLLSSLKELKIENYKIFKFFSYKNWVWNTYHKVSAIREILENTSYDVLWVDADAKIKKYPKLVEKIPPEYDVGFFYLDREKWYGRNYPDHDKIELLTGTLFFKNKNICRELLKEWEKFPLKKIISSQKSLRKILSEFSQKLNIFTLPIEYCYIDSLPNGKKGNIKVKDPIIVHYQASRKYKKILR